MALPKAFQQHVTDAEERLKMVKDRVESGSYGPDAVQMHASIIGADLLLAATILSGAMGEEALSDRYYHPGLGPN